MLTFQKKAILFLGIVCLLSSILSGTGSAASPSVIIAEQHFGQDKQAGKVYIKEIVIQTNLKLNDYKGELGDVGEVYLDKDLSLSDIDRFREKVMGVFRQYGYPTTTTDVNEQSLTKGELRIRVSKGNSSSMTE